MDKEIYCFSYFLVKKKYRNHLLKALSALIPPTLAEEGCLQYELLIDKENPLHIIMLEKFTSRAALDYHERTDYIKRFVAEEMYLYCKKINWHIAYAPLPFQFV